jgi:cytochrome c-type biogenesis protein CcmE
MIVADLSPKFRRGLGILLILAALGLAAMLVLSALRDHVVFFYGPSDIQAKASGGQIVRLGGLVVDDSIQQGPDGIRFEVTDQISSIEVEYKGILPDLFREGQGVITEGRLDGNIFRADTVLAKHDETYMPVEVADLLKEQGTWKGQD